MSDSLPSENLQEAVDAKKEELARVRELIEMEAADSQATLAKLHKKLALGLSRLPVYAMTSVHGGGMGTRSRARKLYVRLPGREETAEEYANSERSACGPSAPGTQAEYKEMDNPDTQHGFDPWDAHVTSPSSPYYNDAATALLESWGPRTVTLGRVRDFSRYALAEWKWCSDSEFKGSACTSFEHYGSIVSKRIEQAYQQAVLNNNEHWMTPVIKIDDGMFIRVKNYPFDMYETTLGHSRTALPMALQLRVSEAGEILCDAEGRPRQRAVVRFLRDA